MVVDDDQIVVRVEGKFVGIERPSVMGGVRSSWSANTPGTVKAAAPSARLLRNVRRLGLTI
jgi:hypothetical protein